MFSFFRTARNFFSRKERSQIVKAIHEAESKTSGEIRVHLENYCKHPDLLEHTVDVFRILNMDKTAGRNGVLIYLSVKDHKYSIYADEGINEVVPDDFWQGIIDTMEGYFKDKKFLEGILKGIDMIGEKLKVYFPVSDDDKNELPDDISYG